MNVFHYTHPNVRIWETEGTPPVGQVGIRKPGSDRLHLKRVSGNRLLCFPDALILHNTELILVNAMHSIQAVSPSRPAPPRPSFFLPSFPTLLYIYSLTNLSSMSWLNTYKSTNFLIIYFLLLMRCWNRSSQVHSTIGYCFSVLIRPFYQKLLLI